MHQVKWFYGKRHLFHWIMGKFNSYSDLVSEVLETNEFRNELYVSAVSVAINRLENHSSHKVSEKELLEFIQDVFKTPEAKHTKTVHQERLITEAEFCRLTVNVVKGENLAVKDVDGASDPYCLLAVVPTSQYVDLKSGKHLSKQTKTIFSNLNPEWNESVEIDFKRNEIDTSSFQLQVWDYDGKNDDKKKVRGIKGVTR